jgi:hypothetical protein
VIVLARELVATLCARKFLTKNADDLVTAVHRVERQPAHITQLKVDGWVEGRRELSNDPPVQRTHERFDACRWAGKHGSA